VDNTILYLIISFIAFFIGVLITRWIFGIEKIIDNLNQQTKALFNLSEMLDYQNKVMTAQLHLISSIAEKAGVPLEDINEVTRPFDIEFTE